MQNRIFVCVLGMLVTAFPAMAQITVDLDVLDVPASDKKTVLTAPAPVVQKAPTPLLTAPVTTPVTKKAPVAASEKKVATKKSDVVKKSDAKKNTNKLHVTESAVKDAHDVLKPRANPVPQVKIITKQPATPVKNPEPQPQPVAKTDVAEETVAVEKNGDEKADVSAVTQVLTERVAEVQKQPETPTVQTEPAVASKDAVVEAEQKQSETPTVQTEPVVAPNDAVVEAEQKTPSFVVDPALSDAERSAFLKALLPADSPTTQMLAADKLLRDVFEFDRNSVTLTAESRERLDDLVAYLTANADKRVIVLAYTSMTAPEYGRERQLTLRRALFVRSYLADKGIRTLRVEIRSLGTKGAGERYPDRADIVVYTR